MQVLEALKCITFSHYNKETLLRKFFKHLNTIADMIISLLMRRQKLVCSLLEFPLITLMTLREPN